MRPPDGKHLHFTRSNEELHAPEDRWAWNFVIQRGHPVTVRENQQWKSAVAYCSYAGGFVVTVKGTKASAEEICQECRGFLEDRLKLTSNIEKPISPTSTTDLSFWGTEPFASEGRADRCPSS